MRDLMKFGMVLVVLAMVAGTAFAKSNPWVGDFEDGTWCASDDNWKREIPYYGDGDKVQIQNGEEVTVTPADCGDEAGAHEMELRKGKLNIGVANLAKMTFTMSKDLELSDGKSSDSFHLNIVNAEMIVEDGSSDVGEDGDFIITVAEGSSLEFEEGLKVGESGEDDSTQVFNLAGDMDVSDDRFEQYHGLMTINLTGKGSLSVTDTSRWSRRDGGMTTVDISGTASCDIDHLELGNSDDGAKHAASVVIKVSGDGSFSCNEVRFEGEGQIFNVTVTGNGSVSAEDLAKGEDDAEVNLTVNGAGASVYVDDDLEMGTGKIKIIDGIFELRDDLKLRGDSSMTVEADGEVWIDDLYMYSDSELTINGVRMDIDDLKKDDGSIEINGAGELVIKNADDQEDLDEINELIADGDITTSTPGMTVVADYGVSHGGRLTIKLAIGVDVDIKPGSCPNPLRVNFRGNGVFTVAIVGSDTFDVKEDLNQGTITLEGVSPLRAKEGDVSHAGDVCEVGPDGTLDLVLKFSRQAILDALEGTYGDLADIPNREALTLTLSAETNDGDPVVGSDTLTILNRGAIKRRR